jgi:hypothetical protein
MNSVSDARVKLRSLLLTAFDPRAVHRDQFSAKQVQLAAEQHKLAEDRAEGAGVIVSEIGDGLKIGLQMNACPYRATFVFLRPQGSDPI